MFSDKARTQNIQVGDEVEVFGHADHVANRVYSGKVIRKTPSQTVMIKLDHNQHEYRFAKCGRGLGVNPFTILSKYLS